MRVDPVRGPISTPQRLNRYTYVRNNPINRTDPFGLMDCFQRADGCWVCDDLEIICDRSGDLPQDFGSWTGLRIVEPPPSETPPIETDPGDLIDTLLKILAEKLGIDLKQCERDLLRNELKNADYDTGIHYITKLAGAWHIAQKFERRNGGPQDDNPVNANKHCIWACELSRRFGEETSRIWTDAHECGGTGPSNNMDYHNNFIGRWLGVQESNRGKTCEELCGAEDVQVGGTPSWDSLFAIEPQR